MEQNEKATQCNEEIKVILDKYNLVMLAVPFIGKGGVIDAQVMLFEKPEEEPKTKLKM